TSCFGWRYNPAIKTQDFHTGIDLAIPIGTEIKAAEDGEVIKLMNGDGSIPIGDYGNYVILKHNFNGATYYTLYAHLKCSGVKVNVGDKVKKGDVIALSGGTDNCKGTSTGAHLHFEIREGTNNQRSSINPCLLLENCNCDISCEKYSQKDDPNKCPKS
ncbi:MAG: M23 family metallopeptidase, partial [Candidatus Aenigmarchaeota archaeon]|nr:M23 family metallopeptidase [Candidatus Aenigmarchaeota archaeon]